MSAIEKHFDFYRNKAKRFVQYLTNIHKQTCQCTVHRHMPLQGNNTQNIPMYKEIKNLVQADEPWSGKYILSFTYMLTLQAWILSKVYNYYTPSMKEEVLKKHFLPIDYDQCYLAERF